MTENALNIAEKAKAATMVNRALNDINVAYKKTVDATRKQSAKGNNSR